LVLNFNEAAIFRLAAIILTVAFVITETFSKWLMYVFMRRFLQLLIIGDY